MKRQGELESINETDKRFKHETKALPTCENERAHIDSSVRPALSNAPVDWTPHALPSFPKGFLNDEFVLPAHQTRLSECINKHPRDSRIVFEEGPHLYYVDGIKCSWSVTTLCHKFSEHFDEGATIIRMRRSNNWPRSQYATKCPAQWRRSLQTIVDIFKAEPHMPDDLHIAEQLIATMMHNVHANEVVDTSALCTCIQNIKKSSGSLTESAQLVIRTAIDDVAFTDHDIKLHWERNRQDAANRGTWFHLQAELWLNRDNCYLGGPEMGLFLKYIKGHLEPLNVQVYRTEWEVYGEEEDLAGSIDFVGEYTSGPLKGQLFLGDWKRSRDLRNKGRHIMGKMMTGSMNQMPDCAKAHYTLQLNCYAFLIEKYYEKKVGRMEVICVHEDNGDEPYWFEVPRMTTVTAFLMAYQRKECADAILNRYETRMNTDTRSFPK